MKDVKNLQKLAQVIIIRHGEKKKDDAVDLDGAGKERAKHLPDFLLDSQSPWKRPDVIYAMKQKDENSSKRPLETVKPLAKRLGLTIEKDEVNDTSTFYNNFTKKQTEELVDSILDGSHEGKTVLVCWEHKLEVDIANHLGIPVKGWGLDPFQENGGTEKDIKKAEDNFTAIWVLTPAGDNVKFEVFKEFDVDPNPPHGLTFPEKPQLPLVTKVFKSDELEHTMKQPHKVVASDSE